MFKRFSPPALLTIFQLQTQYRALIRKLDIMEETKELALLTFLSVTCVRYAQLYYHSSIISIRGKHTSRSVE